MCVSSWKLQGHSSVDDNEDVLFVSSSSRSTAMTGGMPPSGGSGNCTRSSFSQDAY